MPRSLVPLVLLHPPPSIPLCALPSCVSVLLGVNISPPKDEHLQCALLPGTLRTSCVHSPSVCPSQTGRTSPVFFVLLFGPAPSRLRCLMPLVESGRWSSSLSKIRCVLGPSVCPFLQEWTISPSRVDIPSVPCSLLLSEHRMSIVQRCPSQTGWTSPVFFVHLFGPTPSRLRRLELSVEIGSVGLHPSSSLRSTVCVARLSVRLFKEWNESTL